MFVITEMTFSASEWMSSTGFQKPVDKFAFRAKVKCICWSLALKQKLHHGKCFGIMFSTDILFSQNKEKNLSWSKIIQDVPN